MTSSQKAIERWQGVLRGIAIEEMLHLALVANVMSSIGAAPYFGRPNFPQGSGYFPTSIQLDLMPFGERALSHFLFLERPKGMERQDAEGFVPTAPRRDPLSESAAMPRGQEFLTVGHLYRGIEDGLRRLAGELGERALFVGSPRTQATPELFHWPQVVAVTDLDSALRAVGEIIAQDEGARGHWEDAHCGRFLGIWDECHALREADPTFEPARHNKAPVTGDRVLLERLIANPLDNAERYNHPDGTVNISTTATPRHPPPCVRDRHRTGDPQRHGRTPVFALPRLNDRTARDGFGLDLALVSSIAAVHGGTLDATAISSGGLDITLRLPRRTEARTPASGACLE